MKMTAIMLAAAALACGCATKDGPGCDDCTPRLAAPADDLRAKVETLWTAHTNRLEYAKRAAERARARVRNVKPGPRRPMRIGSGR